MNKVSERYGTELKTLNACNRKVIRRREKRAGKNIQRNNG